MASGEEEKAEQKRRATEDTAGTDDGRTTSERRYLPPTCFCVSRGNKGVTGEFRGCRGNKGVRGFFGADEGVEKLDMAQEQRPRSITGEA